MTHPPAAWHADPADPSRLRWWDGQQWTAHTAPVQPQAAVYRSSRGLAVASAVVVLMIVVTEVILTAVSYPSYNRISDAMSQGYDGTDVFTAYDGFTLGQVLLEVAAYVVSCLWLWRVRRNAEVLNPTARHARSRGWVWGGWVCPVVAWWFPYQVVRDVMRATAPDTAPVGRWWAAFIVWGISSNAFVRLVMDGVVPVMQAVSLVASILAASWWMAVVRRVERIQRAHASAGHALTS